MLAGLSALELGRLRLSVGYGTHKKGRPLTPVEVGLLIQKARSEGVSLDECAAAIQLDGTGHIGRFLRILDLPEDVQDLIDWGSGKGFIGFTSAVELTNIKSSEDQRTLAQTLLSRDLNSKEIRQVVQLLNRSEKSIEACVEEVVGMRPTVEKRYVFVGSISSDISDVLGELTQAERDAILVSGLEELGIRVVNGRLGRKFFTLIGQEDFHASMLKIGKENIETRIRCYITEALEHVLPSR